MSLFRILLRFLSLGRLGFSRGEEKALLRALERRDYRYIMEVGVPRVEAPRLPPVSPLSGYPAVAEGVDIGSMMLSDPEVLMYLLQSTSSRGDALEVSGDGVSLIKTAADYSRGRPGVFYFDGVEGSIEVRMIAAGGLVAGVYVLAGGRELAGVRAVEELESLSLGGMTLWVARLKERLLEWNDAVLSVYVRGLDNQHKYLVNTLNSLYTATVHGQGNRVVTTILRRMSEYTRFHFKSEEILMEKYEYPEDKLEMHRREHRAFVKAVEKFREEYEAGERALSVEIFKFLATWIAKHVAGTDRDYGEYFRSIGVANYIPES